MATVAVVYLMLAPEQWMNYLFWVEYHALGLSDDFPQKVALLYYWFIEGAYAGEGFYARNFLVCMIVAVLPLLAALWLFRRKAY
jgi:hypothetical protein